MRKRYFLTVCSLRLSSSAVSRLLSPSATRATTCSSRGVSSARPWVFTTRNEGTSETLIKKIVHLFGVGPYLAFGDPLDTAAQRTEVTVIETENSADARAECADHEVAVIGLRQQNFRESRIQKMNLTQGG